MKILDKYVIGCGYQPAYHFVDIRGKIMKIGSEIMQGGIPGLPMNPNGILIDMNWNNKEMNLSLTIGIDKIVLQNIDEGMGSQQFREYADNIFQQLKALYEENVFRYVGTIYKVEFDSDISLDLFSPVIDSRVDSFSQWRLVYNKGSERYLIEISVEGQKLPMLSFDYQIWENPSFNLIPSILDKGRKEFEKFLDAIIVN